VSLRFDFLGFMRYWVSFSKNSTDASQKPPLLEREEKGGRV